MTVSSQDTVFQHVGNGVTTVFAFSCQVPTETDLEVYLNDVLQTSGYVTSGIGSLSGGTVTFSVAPANLTPIRIERVIELERTTDYQQNGDFLSGVVNPDFDRLWMAMQGHQSVLARALVAPKSDTGLPNPLPPAAQRANMLLSFDVDGQPVVTAAAAQSATALSLLLASSDGAAAIGRNEQVVDSVAVLRTLLKTSPSKYAVTTGYYAKGDGGGGRYWYDASDTTSADNGGTIIVAADSGRWKLLLTEGGTNISQWGAKGDGVFNNSAAFTSANAVGPIVVPPGVFRISSNVTLSNQISFKKGASISIDTGIVVTFNGPIMADMYQIFSGLGTVVIGKANLYALPEWWGAGGGTGVDFPAIQKCIDACRSTGRTTLLSQDYFGSAGGLTLKVYPDSPIFTRGNVFMNGIGQANAIEFQPGNYLGPTNELPAFTGWSGDAITLLGTALCKVRSPSVANSGGTGNAAHFKTTTANPTSLDNKVEIFAIGPDVNNGCLFTGAGSAVVSTIQGNEFYSSFIVNSQRACLFTETAAGTNWDGQIVEYAAIDPAGRAGALALNNAAATPVPRLTFICSTWIGGFGGASAGWVSGKFDELDLRLRVANNLTSYTQMAVVGNGGICTLFNSGSSTSVFAATTTQGVANFNGGAPLTQTRFKSSITIPAGGLANNANLFAYVYSPFVSFINAKLHLQFTDSKECILSSINTSANANEIAINLRNVSGGTIAAGTVVTFYITIG